MTAIAEAAPPRPPTEAPISFQGAVSAVRRQALPLAEALPQELLPVASWLLEHFPTATTASGSYGLEAMSTVIARFQAHGYPSPKRMLDALRLSLAIELLGGGWSVNHTHVAMGCCSPTRFHTWFRRLTGTSPIHHAGVDAAACLVRAFSPKETAP